MSAQRRDRHVSGHDRYLPPQAWRLFSDVRARPRPRADLATATRSIDRSELSRVRAELARTRMAGGPEGETIPRERWPPGR
jgi:hypothetical protein